MDQYKFDNFYTGLDHIRAHPQNKDSCLLCTLICSYNQERNFDSTVPRCIDWYRDTHFVRMCMSLLNMVQCGDMGKTVFHLGDSSVLERKGCEFFAYFSASYYGI